MSNLLRDLQSKYDIFSEDELRYLNDGGVSVSDTEPLDSESVGEPFDLSAE